MNQDDTPLHTFRAVFPGEPARVSSGQIRCHIGTDVSLIPDALEAFCFKRITVEDEELIFLAGTIAFADRRIRRRAKEGWRRRLHIVMPVSDPRFWSNPKLNSTLVDALQFLTGDTWSFQFIPRRNRLLKLSQIELSIGGGQFVVMPFSGGMDSFAQAQASKHESPDLTQIRVTAWNNGLSGSRDWLTEADGTRYRRVAVPVRFGKTGNLDLTYRTRSFLFTVLSGLAAHMSGAPTIIIPEAGQGALGPSLVPLGSESPHRGSHPGFTRRMSAFFSAFWGDQINFSHPQLWKTKGQVLESLRGKNLHNGWESKRSCSRDQRDLRVDRHIKIHCGVCSSCLLRRLAVYTAGLAEPSENYMWPDISAPTLRESICKDALRDTGPNDTDIAVHGVMVMEDLARQADEPRSSRRIEQVLFDSFGGDVLEIAQGREKLLQLLTSHKTEWRAYTQQLGPKSWVNQYISML